MLSISQGPEPELIAEAIRERKLFVKMWADRSKTTAHLFYVPTELAKRASIRFPITKENLAVILHQLGQGGRTEVLTHGFRRGLAISLRVALYRTGRSERAEIPRDFLLRVGQIFSWAEGREFWNYSSDFDCFLSKDFLTCESVYYFCLGEQIYSEFCKYRKENGLNHVNLLEEQL